MSNARDFIGKMKKDTEALIRDPERLKAMQITDENIVVDRVTLQDFVK